MDDLTKAFTALASLTGLGPVGALFAVVSGYLLRRLFAIQDKQLDAGVADAKLQADLMNAFGNMKSAFDALTAELRARK